MKPDPARPILIIDDDEQLARVYRLKCEEAGFTVIWCSDGEAGLTAIKEEKPCAVLMGIMLPKKDGFTLLEEARKAGAMMTIVVLTHLGGQADRERALSAGATKYFTRADAQVHEILAVLFQAMEECK